MTDVLDVQDEYRAQQWALVIQECSASGLPNWEFCRQRGISEKSFHYWQRKMRTKLIEAASPQLVEIDATATTDDVFQIRYRGAELKLPTGVDMDAVVALLRSVQSL